MKVSYTIYGSYGYGATETGEYLDVPQTKLGIKWLVASVGVSQNLREKEG